MTARSGAGARDLRTALAFGVPVAVIGVLAFEEGGLGVVVRQQAALAIWWILALGLAFGVVPRSHPPRGWKLAAGGLLALGMVQVASTAWGPSDDRALADACRTLGYLGLLAVAWGLLGPRSWRWASAGLFAIAGLVAVYAFLGRLAPDLPGIGGSPGSGRLAEPLGYWNALAAWAAMTIAMGLAWSADERGEKLRALGLAVVPVAGTVVYLTYSRGGVAASLVAVAIVLGTTRNRRRAALHVGAGAAATALCVLAVRTNPQIADGTGTEGALTVGLSVALAALGCWAFAAMTTRQFVRPASPSAAPRAAIAGGAAVVAVLVAAALAVGSDGFGRGGDAAQFADSDPSARLATAAGNRSAYWSEALDGFAAQPLRGEGAGSFGYRWATGGSDPELVTDPHSLPFATATELGLLGLAALAAFAVGVALVAIRGLEAARQGARACGLLAAVGAFTVSCTVDWTWESTALASLGLGCIGVLAMAASRPIARGASPMSGPVRWALAVAAIAFGAIQVPAVVSAGFVEESAEQRVLGDSAAAVDQADAAITAAPWSALAYAARAEANLSAGDLIAAQDDANAAIDREPREASHLILLALVEAEADDLPAAAVALRDAVRWSPHDRKLGSREVIALGTRLERNGFDDDDILGPGAPE